MIKYIIGIDAGGTSTKIAAIDTDGNFLLQRIGAAGSPAVIGNKAWENIEKGIDSLINEMNHNRYELVFIQMGISGLGIIIDIQTVEAYFAAKFKVQCNIESDAAIALYSLIRDREIDGIIALSGTGSAVCATKNSRMMLMGGWGHLLTERGSAFACVHQTILTMIDKFQGNRPFDEFEEAFLDHLGYSSIYMVKELFFCHNKGEIAQNALYIANEALNGNVFAQNVLREEGRALARQVVQLSNKLNLSAGIIGLRGSFALNEFVKDGFFVELQKNGLKLNYENDNTDPIYGTYYLYKLRGLKC